MPHPDIAPASARTLEPPGPTRDGQIRKAWPILTTLDASALPPWHAGLHALWTDLRRTGPVPLFRTFRPEDHPRYLGWLSVVECAPAGNFRYRLVGTRMVELAQRDATGCRVQDLYRDDDRRQIIEALTWVRDEAHPLLTQGCLPDPRRQWIAVQTLCLPFTSDGQRVNRILIGLQPTPRVPAAGTAANDPRQTNGHGNGPGR